MDMQVRTALTDAKRPVLTFYTFHLAVLSSLNIACLFVTGMGLWIFGNGNNGTAQWVPDPSDSRGTWTILSTCIITLTLCVYTSLHLNVPAHRSTVRDAIFMKAKYVVFGLLAPELIVFNAWRQRSVASALVARLRQDRGGKQTIGVFRTLCGKLKTFPRKIHQELKVLPKRLTGKVEKDKHENGLPLAVNKDPWADMTLVHGFYIVMGGYVFDISKDTRLRMWPRKVDRLTPSVMSVLNCLTSHDKELRQVVPFISEGEIWDKSKANSLAKSIVCIQAIWFCAQCIVRLGQGMPVSLLELNTFAHAICALLVYVLWWDKPLDVQEPTVMDVTQSNAARNVCALAWSGPQAPVPHLRRVIPNEGLWSKFLDLLGLILKGSMECHLGDGPLIGPNSGQKPTPKNVVCAQIADLKRPLALQRRPTHFEGLEQEEMDSRIWTSSDPPVFALDGAEPIPSTSLTVSNEWSSIDIDEILLERIKTVEKLRKAPNWSAYDTAFSRILDSTDPDLRMLKPRELNFTDSLMRQSYDVSPVGRNLTGTSGIILSGLLYGGLHLIAWGSSAFNSPIEDLAWKISCFVVASGGLFTFAGIFGLDIATRRKNANRRMDIMMGLVYVATPISAAYVLLYLVCRVYLVFEVFRNLAFLDPKVYETPDWDVYFPHIS